MRDEMRVTEDFEILRRAMSMVDTLAFLRLRKL